MEQFVEDYLAHCRAAGLSPTTLSRSYGYSLRGVFLPWCREQGIERPSSLSSRDVDRFVDDLLQRGGKRGQLSKHTAWTYAKAAKLFLAWARAEGEDVEADVRLPRLPKRLVDTLDREEVQRIENAASNQRDALIVRVLADSGVRVGELVRLRISDILTRDDHHFLKVRGKGDRERLVPIAPPLYRRLLRFVERYRPDNPSSDRLFLSRRRGGNTGGYGPLTDSGVQQLIRDLGERAGVKKRVHPHLFRHSAATHMLRRGMNPLLVAEVLGHTSLAMIQNVYSHLTPVDAHSALMAVLRSEE